MAEIASHTVMSKGAFQHHFATKAELLAAVVAAGWDDLADQLAQLPAPPEAPEARVRELVHVTWESYQRPSCLAAFVISTDPNLGVEVRTEPTAGFHDVRCRLDQLWAERFVEVDVSDATVANTRRFARSHLLGMLAQRRLPHGSRQPTTNSDGSATPHCTS